MGGLPRLELGLDRGLAARIERLQPGFLGRALGRPRSTRRRDRKAGTKLTMTTPPLAGSSRSTSSGTLRGCGIERGRVGVGEDHRRPAGGDRVLHRRRRDVAEIDQHPEPVHFLDDLDAERAEAVIFRLVGRAVGPFGRLVVGQGHVARAEVVELAQRGERAADLPAALDRRSARRSRPALWIRTTSSAVEASSRSRG